MNTRDSFLLTVVITALIYVWIRWSGFTSWGRTRGKSPRASRSQWDSALKNLTSTSWWVPSSNVDPRNWNHFVAFAQREISIRVGAFCNQSLGSSRRTVRLHFCLGFFQRGPLCQVAMFWHCQMDNCGSRWLCAGRLLRFRKRWTSAGVGLE